MGLMTRHGQISPLFPGEGEGVRGGVNPVNHKSQTASIVERT